MSAILRETAFFSEIRQIDMNSEKDGSSPKAGLSAGSPSWSPSTSVIDLFEKFKHSRLPDRKIACKSTTCMAFRPDSPGLPSGQGGTGVLEAVKRRPGSSGDKSGSGDNRVSGISGPERAEAFAKARAA
jgi:hypothetical protein